MTLPDASGWLPARCHCGAVRFRVRLTGGWSEAHRCDCSFCRRKGVIAGTAMLDDLEIVQGAGNLSLYTFGTHTAQHHFCRTCGIHTHHRRRSNPDELGVNLACIEGVNPRDFGEVPWSDGVDHSSDG